MQCFFAEVSWRFTFERFKVCFEKMSAYLFKVEVHYESYVWFSSKCTNIEGYLGESAGRDIINIIVSCKKQITKLKRKH